MFFHVLILPCIPNRIPTTHLFLVKQGELSICRKVKGCHECPFKVNIGETFYAFKKRGECGNAFKVANYRGSSPTFKLGLLVRFDPYKKRLMYKFENN